MLVLSSPSLTPQAVNNNPASIQRITRKRFFALRVDLFSQFIKKPLLSLKFTVWFHFNLQERLLLLLPPGSPATMNLVRFLGRWLCVPTFRKVCPYQVRIRWYCDMCATIFLLFFSCIHLLCLKKIILWLQKVTTQKKHFFIRLPNNLTSTTIDEYYKICKHHLHINRGVLVGRWKAHDVNSVYTVMFCWRIL